MSSASTLTVDLAPWEEARNSDPGEENVRSGLDYIIRNQPYQGTASFTYAGGTLVSIYCEQADETVIPGVSVWITSDADGLVVVSGVSLSDQAGRVDFMLDQGSEYWVWRELAGYTFSANPFNFTVE